MELYLNAICLVVLGLAIVFNCIAIDGVVTANITLVGYRRFLISLLVSDIYICIVGFIRLVRETLLSAEIIREFRKCFYPIERSFEVTGFTVFVLNLSGMFVDHLIGLVYPIKYREWQRTALAKGVVFIFWTVALMIALADHPVATTIRYLLAPAPKKQSVFSPRENCTGPNNSNNTVQSNECLLAMVDDFVLKMKQPDSLEPLDADSQLLSWCSQSASGKYNNWLVIGLSIGSVIFMAICNAIFSNRLRKMTDKPVGRTQHKMRQVVVTTVILLAAFSVCWIPFGAYEITMMLRYQTGNNGQSDTAVRAVTRHLFVNQVLHSLFACSPLVAPVVLVLRLRAVRRSLMTRHCYLKWLSAFESEAPPAQEPTAVREALIHKPPQAIPSGVVETVR